MAINPSTTGNDPILEDGDESSSESSQETEMKRLPRRESGALGNGDDPTSPREKLKPNVRVSETKRLQRKATRKESKRLTEEEKIRRKQKDALRPPSLWNVYCAIVTFWAPGAILACFGKPARAQQRAWREKMGLISIILMIAAFVGFLTFGFTQAVCGTPPQNYAVNKVGVDMMAFHGQAYNLNEMQHPAAVGILKNQNPLYDLDHKYGGEDGSFFFQNVNGACKGLITLAKGSDVPTDSQGNLAWYFPCTSFKQDGSSKPNLTIDNYLGYACHTTGPSREAFYSTKYLKASGSVIFGWDDVRNSSRNLTVYNGAVLDLNLLNWFNSSQVDVPPQFAKIQGNTAIRGVDVTHAFVSGGQKQIGDCLSQIIKVGSIDSSSVGCIASEVVLYVSLVFILAIVMVKFVLALAYQWFLSRRYSASKSSITLNPWKRAKQIEHWADDIYRQPPKLTDSSVMGSSKRGSAFLPTTSRFTNPYDADRTSKHRPAPTTMGNQSSSSRLLSSGDRQSRFGDDMSSDPTVRNSIAGSRSSYMMSGTNPDPRLSALISEEVNGPRSAIHDLVVPQPPSDWRPFGYPLAHTICLVTAYSEGEEGMRTTLDSIATTEYPNSHKCIMLICDGMVKGHGENLTTPQIALGMMRDFVVLPEEVQAFSYVAVASGAKRHNMARVYAGFYDYGEGSRVPARKQQRVPMVIVVKCGTPDEATKSKPGNRGKRDSQIIIMGFLQKVMFDERMTELEFEMFNGLWKVTGIPPDFYEMMLMVDADTKVFPDSLTHMCSAMVYDPEIMGLCGETKIANKRASWVAMIQVFEYFISHHLSKSFESVFGGVTCLPGCFSMYRIKAPKGSASFWVPILANPDVVEHYSENVVDTLHKKNLYLLGEDRYLSTLMLKTFPKRKQVFVPQAVCKTTVPEQFKVLLSQRRRWINSTVHNLMELVLVRDLCGTFCFSMQFVVFIELVGTLVLP